MTQTPQDTAEPGRFRRDGVHDLGDLRRSVSDRKLAGVAGGLGRHFDIDPTVLRVAFVVLTLFGGAGAVVYLVAYLFVPEEGSEHALISTSPGTRAALLTAAGVLAVAIVVSHTFGHWWFPWPLAVIAVVVALIWMNRDKQMDRTPAPPPADQPLFDEEYAGVVPPPPPPYYAAPPQTYQPRPRSRRGPLLFAPTLAALAVALGALGLYDALGGSVVPAAYPALALAVIGGMLVLGSRVGRPGGLIALGLAAALALAGASLAHTPFESGRQLTATPSTASALHDHYFLPAGQIRLDLTRMDPAGLDGRDITVRARAGQIMVVLPRDVRAHVVADTALGEIDIDGRTVGGPRDHVVRDIGSGSTTLTLDLNLYLGRIAVRQVPVLPQTPAAPTGLTEGAAR